MGTFRTPEQEEIYRRYIREGGLAGGCPLCVEKPLKEFKFWNVLNNRFPYDKIAKVHHMIAPKRHVAEPELSPEEVEEYKQIKEDYLHKTYEFLLEATYRKKTIPGHFHIHLGLVKD